MKEIAKLLTGGIFIGLFFALVVSWVYYILQYIWSV